MKPISPLDEAEMRLSARKMYKDIGYVGCLQVIYEILRSADIICEVVNEESKKEIR